MIPLRWLEQRCLASIFHARASPSTSLVQTVSRRRTQQSYRFAASFTEHVTGTVLDIGSGWGLGVHHLLDAGAQRVIAVDPEQTLQTAPIYQHPRVSLQACDLPQADIPADSIDLALCVSVEFYVPDLTSLISSVARFARPYALLIINTVNPRFLRTLFHETSIDSVPGLYIRGLEALRGMLHKHGFRVIQELDQTTISTLDMHGFKPVRCIDAALRASIEPHTLVPVSPKRVGFYRFLVCQFDGHHASDRR